MSVYHNCFLFYLTGILLGNPCWLSQVPKDLAMETLWQLLEWEFFHSRCPSLLPSQQHQVTKGVILTGLLELICFMLTYCCCR